MSGKVWKALVFVLAVVAGSVIVVKMNGSGPAPTGQAEGEPSARKSPRVTLVRPTQKPVAKPTSLATAAPGANPNSRAPAQTEDPGEAYLNRFAPGWKASRDENSGRITTFTGGIIPGEGKSPERALKLARGLASVMGIPPEQISAEQKGSSESARALAYHFPQKVGDYDVYGSDITVLARKSDGGVYIVNPGAKPVDLPLPEIEFTSAQGLEFLKARYADRAGTQIKLEPQAPYVWAESAPAELAWNYSVTFSNPKVDHWQVMIGASSKRVLMERSVLVH